MRDYTNRPDPRFPSRFARRPGNARKVRATTPEDPKLTPDVTQFSETDSQMGPGKRV